MEIHQKSTIYLLVTPRELRKMADEMESKWKSSEFGDSLTTEVLSSADKNTEIRFIIDQAKINHSEN